ncbi:MAG: hypothetical protein JW742_09065 [Candidatus Aminicenantes bacterium]|nr:hypothetical protein [Candidatus Aminicenantes bacterium]
MNGVRSLAACLVLAGLVLPARAARTDRVGVGLASGLFVPAMKEVREIYGLAPPVALVLTWTKKSGLAFGLGFEYLSAGGRTVGSAEESLPLRLRLWTVPASINYEWDYGWIRFSAGLGAALNIYRERWEAEGLEGLSDEGQRLGVFARGTAEIPVSSRLSAAGIARYGTVSTNVRSYLGNSVNLGGATLLVGLSYSFSADVAVGVGSGRRRDER